MSETERATCTVCGRELTRAEFAYCADHRGVLWENAPLPPGHPGGKLGRDLDGVTFAASNEDAKVEPRQLELFS